MRKKADKEEGNMSKNGDLEIVQHRSQSSVTVKRDAKGVLSWEVKAYGDHVGDSVEGAVGAVYELERKLDEYEESRKS